MNYPRSPLPDKRQKLHHLARNERAGAGAAIIIVCVIITITITSTVIIIIDIAHVSARSWRGSVGALVRVP